MLYLKVAAPYFCAHWSHRGCQKMLCRQVQQGTVPHQPPTVLLHSCGPVHNAFCALRLRLGASVPPGCPPGSIALSSWLWPRRGCPATSWAHRSPSHVLGSTGCSSPCPPPSVLPWELPHRSRSFDPMSCTPSWARRTRSWHRWPSNASICWRTTSIASIRIAGWGSPPAPPGYSHRARTPRPPSRARRSLPCHCFCSKFSSR